MVTGRCGCWTTGRGKGCGGRVEDVKQSPPRSSSTEHGQFISQKCPGDLLGRVGRGPPGGSGGGGYVRVGGGRRSARQPQASRPWS